MDLLHADLRPLQLIRAQLVHLELASYHETLHWCTGVLSNRAAVLNSKDFLVNCQCFARAIQVGICSSHINSSCEVTDHLQASPQGLHGVQALPADAHGASLRDWAY